jgi:hypothetical protein
MDTNDVMVGVMIEVSNHEHMVLNVFPFLIDSEAMLNILIQIIHGAGCRKKGKWWLK